MSLLYNIVVEIERHLVLRCRYVFNNGIITNRVQQKNDLYNIYTTVLYNFILTDIFKQTHDSVNNLIVQYYHVEKNNNYLIIFFKINFIYEVRCTFIFIDISNNEQDAAKKLLLYYYNIYYCFLFNSENNSKDG